MMKKKKGKAAVLVLALIVLTGCGSFVEYSYGEFDLMSEYMNRHAESIITDTTTIFGCEADVLNKNANAEQITRLYLEALAEGKEKGYVPVVVFLDNILEETVKNTFENANGMEAYINSVLSNDHTNGKELLDKKYSDLEKIYEDGLIIDNDELDAMLSRSGNSNRNFLPSGDSLRGEVYLLHIPADNASEVFAWLPFGGWNNCPGTNDMIAACRYWYDEYGAVPAAVSHDTLTFYLNEPVTDRQTAVKAAKEQLAFCDEILGIGGMNSYVMMTLNSNVWSFWWD